MRSGKYHGSWGDARWGKCLAMAIGLSLLLWAMGGCDGDSPKKPFSASQKESRTATVILYLRAIGAHNPDPKTRNPDYLAPKIADQEVMRKRMRWTGEFEPMVQGLIKKKSWMFFYFTARTKHMDAVLAKELKAGASQVVILGAGYDTRAYRFHKEYPKARFFEVDLPAMTAVKKKVMSEKLADLPVNVTYAPIDFNTQDLGTVLAKLGYQKNQKTLFIWEGVVYYLDPAAVESTLHFIAKNSAPGSSVVFDYLPPSVVNGTNKNPYAKTVAEYVRSVGEPFTFGIEPDNCGAFLKKQNLTQVSDIGHDYLVKEYMTSSNGKPFGTLPDFFRITQAKVSAN